MKNIFIIRKLFIFAVSCYSLAVFGCPYTFINDSAKKLFLGEKISFGYLLAPGKQTIIEAPMNPEHEEYHKEQGTTHGEHKDAPGEESNGHASIYVYSEGQDEKFNLEYKIRERACGKNSVLKYSELEAMAAGDKDAGRFAIKKVDSEDKKKKLIAYK